MSTLEQLLENWESVYKKGLLTFWLLLLLDEKPSYPYEMSAAVQNISQGMITADENSIYRAIKRFEEMGLVLSQPQESKLGPTRKYYRLTEIGHELLRRFIERNIHVFEIPAVAERIQHVLENRG
jgi:PadR family transcriptional regulator PadR